jgi:hypothetical protein
MNDRWFLRCIGGVLLVMGGFGFGYSLGESRTNAHYVEVVMPDRVTAAAKTGYQFGLQDMRCQPDVRGVVP